MTCPSETIVAQLVDGELADAARAEVMTHLDDCSACREVIGNAAALASPAPAGVLRAGCKVGRYVIVEIVGAGAMGVVYRALDPELSRDIALKILREPADDVVGERLIDEAQALARLAHPNVIAVHDVGVHDGQVFLAMELARETLAAWLRRVRPRADDILHVLHEAGAGLAAAHAAGLVHGDIKPDNVLLGHDGRARVTDFGLARAERVVPDDDRAPLAGRGRLIGTPAYMGPEKLRGGAGDARSDQFAFCATLFEALTGQWPFRAETIGELRERVAGGRVDREAVNRLPRWARAIILRGLRAAPADRWPDMAALLRALDRGPRRQRVRAAVLAGLAVVTAAAVALALVSMVREVRLGRIAEARANELIVLQAQNALDSDPTAALAWLKQLPPDAANWRDAIAVARDAASRGVAAEVIPGGAGPVWAVAASPDGRHVASVHGTVVRLADLAGGAIELNGHASDVTRLAFAVDGRLASAGGGMIAIWDARGQLMTKLTGYQGEIEGLAFSRSGLLASTGEDGIARLWDLATGRARVAADAGRRCNDIAFAPDDQSLAIACTGGLILIAPVAGGAARSLTVADPLPRTVAFVDAGGALLVTGRAGAETVRLDGTVARGARTSEAVLAAGLAPAADRLVFGTLDHGSRVMSAARGSAIETLVGQRGIYAAAMFADGRTVATGALDGSVRIWRLAPADQRIFEVGSAVHAVSVSPDGSRIAAGAANGELHVWDVVHGGPPNVLDAGPGVVDFVDYLPDGRIVSFADSGAGYLWRDGERTPLGGGKTAVNSLAIARAGDALAWSDSEAVHIRGLAARASFGADLAMPSNAELAFVDAQLVIAAEDDVRVCEAARCAATQKVVVTTERPVMSVAASSDGRTLGVSTSGGQLHVIDLVTGGHREIGGGYGDLLYLAVSPDGRTIAAANIDGRVMQWDAATGERRDLWRHALRSTALAFTRDGAAILGAAKDGTIWIVDAATGEQRILRGHDGAVLDLALSARGDTAISAGADGTVRVWPVRGDEPHFASHGELAAWLAAQTTAVIDDEHRAATPAR